MGGKRKIRVLFEAAAIASRNETLAAEIAGRQLKDLLIVAVMKGSFIFAADLIRAMHKTGIEPHVEFMHLSSYRDATVSSGQVKILKDIESTVKGRAQPGTPEWSRLSASTKASSASVADFTSSAELLDAPSRCCTRSSTSSRIGA